MVARATLLRDQIEQQPGDQPCGIDGAMSAGDPGGDWVEPARAHVLCGSDGGRLTVGRVQLSVDSLGLPPEVSDFGTRPSARGSA